MSPYIITTRREEFFNLESQIMRSRVDNAGELNYVLTQVMLHYVAQHGLRYQSINDCLGALAGAGHEFYRRVAAKLEDQKCEENGDVYDVFDGEKEGE